MNTMEPWWRQCSAVLRYMPGEDHKTIEDIAAELPDIVEQGYQAIQITAPYASAGFRPWWGLRPYDYFALNDELRGNMEDFRSLLRQCHRLGLRVILFLNLGYADITSPLWKIACRNRKNGIHGMEDALFLWSHTDTLPFPSPADLCFRRDGFWQWSDDAACFCRSFWTDGIIAEPQYDWQSPAVPRYIRDVLEFWLETGADGIIVDAVNRYLNCNMPLIRTCITDVIHQYPQVMCIPEGATGFGDPFLPWMTEGGFDMIEDQTFHSDLHWNGSAILNALTLESPNLLDNALAVCRAVRSMGSACWSYLSWGNAWTPEHRLLEIALLIASGHMTEIIPSYLSDFLTEHHEILRRILRMTNQCAFAPSVERDRLYDAEPACCYVLLCVSEKSPVLCVFNLSESAQDVRISILQAGFPPASDWYDHISQQKIAAADNRLSLQLPPCGFALAVPAN